MIDARFSEIDKGSCPLHKDEVQANARLIAAAPEMLGAIEKVRHFLQWHVPTTGQPNTVATALDDHLAEILAKLEAKP